MGMDEILRRMRKERRQLAGQLIKEELNRQGYTTTDQMTVKLDMSSSRMYALFNGDATRANWRKAEGAVELPSGFTEYVMENKISEIERLFMRDDVKQRALNALRDLAIQLADIEVNGETNNG